MMGIVVETLIFCDGPRRTCPMNGPYADGDTKADSAGYQRRMYVKDGWIHDNGRDYCPDCAKRLARKGKR